MWPQEDTVPLKSISRQRDLSHSLREEGAGFADLYLGQGNSDNFPSHLPPGVRVRLLNDDYTLRSINTGR
jgi:hypothetical protein